MKETTKTLLAEQLRVCRVSVRADQQACYAGESALKLFILFEYLLKDFNDTLLFGSLCLQNLSKVV